MPRDCPMLLLAALLGTPATACGLPELRGGARGPGLGLRPGLRAQPADGARALPRDRPRLGLRVSVGARPPGPDPPQPAKGTAS